MTEERKAWPLGGYAPGGYMGACPECGREFIAAKRAFQCLECAVAWANQRAADAVRLEAESARFRIALWNEMRRSGVDQDFAINHIREVAAGVIEAPPASLTRPTEGEETPPDLVSLPPQPKPRGFSDA